MPIYLYHCEDCKVEFELRRKIAERDVNECPHCNGTKVKRLPVPVNTISIGKEAESHPAVQEKLKPHGQQRGIPYYQTSNSGLNAISYVGGVGYVEHPNLAGPPPGSFGKEGRIVLVKKDD